MKKYDAIIIGFGKAGKTLAPELARQGLSTALVERSEGMYGGTCINIGCIPTKFLIHRAQTDAACPADDDARQARYRDAIASKKRLVAALREKNYRKIADTGSVDIYDGQARFVGERTVEVATAQGVETLTAARIVIDTGAETVLPPIEGIGTSRRVHTSTSIMEMETWPRRLMIVGGGYIGLEFASMYARFGSKVTVLEGGAHFIPREDRDVAACVGEVLAKQGVEVRTGVRVERIADTAGGVNTGIAVDGREETVAADAVLLATGRRPATGALNLEAAGVATDARGAILTDEHLRTSAAGVWAAGDVTGGLQFTYVSLDDARIIRDDMLGEGVRTTLNRGPVPYAVFIDPPLAHVGLHEEEAREAGLTFRTRTIPVATIPRAGTLGTAEGLFKAIVETQTDRILGCTLFGPNAAEAINTVTMAMKHGLTARDLSGAIYTHPSMTETLNDLLA